MEILKNLCDLDFMLRPKTEGPKWFIKLGLRSKKKRKSLIYLYKYIRIGSC